MPSLPKATIKKILIPGCFVLLLLAFSIYLLRPGISTPPERRTSSVSPSAASTQTPEITETPTSVSPTLIPTVATPTVDPFHYTTIKTFKGYGDQNTAPFDVGDNWRISWQCESENGVLTIFLYPVPFVRPSNSPLAFQFPCYSDTGIPNAPSILREGSSRRVPNGGRFSLNIQAADVDWSVSIEEVSAG